MWFLLSSCLSLRVRGRGVAVQRACVNSASDCHVVLGSRKDLKEETKSFLWTGGESMYGWDCFPCQRRAALSIRSCSGGFIPCFGSDFVWWGQGAAQHCAAPHWGCTAKSGKCLCITPCALQCCWGGHWPRLLSSPWIEGPVALPWCCRSPSSFESFSGLFPSPMASLHPVPGVFICGIACQVSYPSPRTGTGVFKLKVLSIWLLL